MTNTTWVLPAKDKWSSPDMAVQYDPAFIAYLGLIFDPTRAVIDCGANSGKVAIFLAKRTTKPVLCFEPSVSSFDALRANVANSGCQNIETVRAAVGRSSGKAYLVGDGTVTAHLTSSTRGARIEVDVVTLDDYIGIDAGLVKVDVEGGEADVLRGARRFIETRRPLLAIEVIDAHLSRGGTSRREIFQLTREMGYKRAVNKFGMKEGPDERSGTCDVFFLPDDWYAPRLYLSYDRLLRRVRSGKLFDPNEGALHADGMA